MNTTRIAVILAVIGAMFFLGTLWIDAIFTISDSIRDAGYITGAITLTAAFLVGLADA